MTAAPSTPPDVAGRSGARLLVGLLGLLGVGLFVPVALLVNGSFGPLIRFDREASADAEHAVESSRLLLHAAQGVTLLGDPTLVTIAAVVLALVLWRRGHGRQALYVVAARVGALVLSQGLKHLVDRARPVFDIPVAHALGPSFPSGHALGSSVFWTTCAVLTMPRVRRPWLLLAGAVLVAVLVAASRVLLGVHYLSDVTGGLLLGLGWSALCTAVFVLERAESGDPVDPEREGIGA